MYEVQVFDDADGWVTLLAVSSIDDQTARNTAINKAIEFFRKEPLKKYAVIRQTGEIVFVITANK